MSDVKCPECGHEASNHGAFRCDENAFNDEPPCACEKSREGVLRAAYATSEAALAEAQEPLRGIMEAFADAGFPAGDRTVMLANVRDALRQLAEARLTNRERDATITFLRGELAEARADYDDVLRERNEARAEVERLTEQRVKQNRSHCELIGLAHEGFAAERHRIAEAVFDAPICPCDDPSDCKHAEVLRGLADRIASGPYAATDEGGRD